MECQICLNHIDSCGLADEERTDQNSFNIMFREGFESHVNVPCHVRPRFNRFTDGDVIKFRLFGPGQYIDIKVVDQDDNPKHPIYGTLYQDLNKVDRRLVESIVLSEDTHLALAEMDEVVRFLWCTL